MKFCDFKLLDFPLQAHVIYQKGIYLGNRSVDELFVALYQVHDFYVELYCRFNTRELVKCISFHSDILLDPYLKQVRLDELLDELLVRQEN